VLADGSDLFDLPSSQVDAWRAEFPDVPVAEVLSRLADWTADNRPSMGRRRIIGWIAGKLAEEAKAPAPQPATNRGGRTRPAAEEHPWRPRMANGEDLTDEEIFEGVPQWMLDREKTKRKPEPTPTGVHANGKQPPLDPAEIGVGDDELPPL
jgi:hypothetical protein